ncbi:hypothetical protein CDAR_238001 [Caerostris darwini]|uniref:Uncharacterized protein n=1 Tax=Caerostris darwini TaxID=1538125 RepID=A0AAV4S593_9ARAC|nr:hypothetical protein CDAR_238001 [Caerostris darwini]
MESVVEFNSFKITIKGIQTARITRTNPEIEFRYQCLCSLLVHPRSNPQDLLMSSRRRSSRRRREGIGFRNSHLILAKGPRALWMQMSGRFWR